MEFKEITWKELYFAKIEEKKAMSFLIEQYAKQYTWLVFAEGEHAEEMLKINELSTQAASQRLKELVKELQDIKEGISKEELKAWRDEYYKV